MFYAQFSVLQHKDWKAYPDRTEGDTDITEQEEYSVFYLFRLEYGSKRNIGSWCRDVFLLPWVHVKTCCFWRTRCQSAVTPHYFWPLRPQEHWLSTHFSLIKSTFITLRTLSSEIKMHKSGPPQFLLPLFIHPACCFLTSVLVPSFCQE